MAWPIYESQMPSLIHSWTACLGYRCRSGGRTWSRGHGNFSVVTIRLINSVLSCMLSYNLSIVIYSVYVVCMLHLAIMYSYVHYVLRRTGTIVLSLPPTRPPQEGETWKVPHVHRLFSPFRLLPLAGSYNRATKGPKVPSQHSIVSS